MQCQRAGPKGWAKGLGRRAGPKRWSGCRTAAWPDPRRAEPGADGGTRADGAQRPRSCDRRGGTFGAQTCNAGSRRASPSHCTGAQWAGSWPRRDFAASRCGRSIRNLTPGGAGRVQKNFAATAAEALPDHVCGKPPDIRFHQFAMVPPRVQGRWRTRGLASRAGRPASGPRVAGRPRAPLAGLAPDPALSVSQRADRHRVLSSRPASEAGPCRTSRTPCTRGIMDALTPRNPLQRVVFMTAAQVGTTEAGNNWIGLCIHRAPGPVLAVDDGGTGKPPPSTTGPPAEDQSAGTGRHGSSGLNVWMSPAMASVSAPRSASKRMPFSPIRNDITPVSPGTAG